MVKRLLALGSLVVVALAVWSIVTATGLGGERPGDELRAQVEEAAGAARTVSGAIGRLRPGDPPRDAVRATREALATVKAARATVAGLDVEPAERAARDGARRALDRETAWLEAVGSVLANPRSGLRDRVADRAQRALDSLAEAGQPGAVSGTRALLAHARARAA